MKEIMRLKDLSYVYTDGKKMVVEYLCDDDDELYYREPNDGEAKEILEFLERRCSWSSLI